MTTQGSSVLGAVLYQLNADGKSTSVGKMLATFTDDKVVLVPNINPELASKCFQMGLIITQKW